MFTLTCLFWFSLIVAILRWHDLIDPLDWRLWLERLKFHSKMFGVGFIDVWIGALGIRDRVQFQKPPQYYQRGHRTAGAGGGLAVVTAIILLFFVVLFAITTLVTTWC
jgi:hypothetical protein